MDDTLICRRRRLLGPPPPDHDWRRRVMTIASMGVLSRGEREFAVAEVKFFYGRRTLRSDKVYADIFWLRSSSPVPGGGAIVDGQWKSARVPVLASSSSSGDKSHPITWQDFSWQTDTVVPVHNRLCWVNNYRGILFCDLFQEPTPTLSLVRFPSTDDDVRTIPASCRRLYCGASAIDAGRALKFVRVIRRRHDGKAAAAAAGRTRLHHHLPNPGVGHHGVEQGLHGHLRRAVVCQPP
ncbi:uncharacterized protein LOC8069248 [Sorghum bicolor]|uniref:uncharacterized protein LOC8069248 n=1 Tax=Sorghum bicolor TaxID=4558 RepID=UPI000B426239|nr:uncharacterized protein LOC8069248 [Sorghum bicolor]|eukprot:XP_021304228.1 uncharacterized protein LOC8069248 [Sorghum bicolor]